MSRVLIFTHCEISATFWVYCDVDLINFERMFDVRRLYDDNTYASSVQSWWTTDHLSNAPTIQLIFNLILLECQTFSFVYFNSIYCFFSWAMPCYIAVGRLVDVGCSSRCILRRSSYISETLLLVLLKLLFIVWLFPVGHLWSSIVLKKQHKTKTPKTLFTLNPGIPGGPGGPGGQIAGHCRVQRQKTESSTASVCREHIFSFLQSHCFHKKHLPEGLHWDHEVYREDPERLNNDTHKWEIRRHLL